MIDSSVKAVALVEITEVAVIRLGDPDERLSRHEGERLRSVAEWREAHEHFSRREVLPELRKPPSLDDDTEIVVERFLVVERFR